MHEVVHRRVSRERTLLAHRVVVKPGDVHDVECGGPCKARDFRGLEQALVFMGAAWHQIREIFGADDGQHEGLEIAIDGGDENVAARPRELAEHRNGRGRIGNVFEHLHAGDHVVFSGLGVLQLFGVFDAIVDLQAGIECVEPCGLHHARREVDCGDQRAGARQRLGEQAAAAAHVENLRIRKHAALLHVARAHGIELVQRLEFAIDIPEAMSRGFEFRNFRGVAVLRMVGRILAGLGRIHQGVNYRR